MTVRFTRTNRPSEIIGYDEANIQFFLANTRTHSLVSNYWLEVISGALNDVIRFDLEAQAIPSKFGTDHYIKLRKVHVDDKHGSYTLFVDYLHNKSESEFYTEEQVQNILKNGSVCSFGQIRWVEVAIKTALFSSDSFHPVSDEYY